MSYGNLFRTKNRRHPPESAAMQFSQEDFDRLLLFEHTRKTAEVNYAKNPLDADVRTLSLLSLSLSLSLYLSNFHLVCINRVVFLLQNLTKWGGALLELSQFQSIADSKSMITGNFLLFCFHKP